MKDLRLLLLAIAALIGMAACNDEEKVVIDDDGVKLKPVTFEIAAKTISGVVNSRAYTPSYSGENLMIYAFRKDNNGTDFHYDKPLAFRNIEYIPLTKTWRGNVLLGAGDYKFVPTYGLNSGNAVALSLSNGQLLSDNLGFSYQSSPGYFLPEIFLPLETVVEQPVYSINDLGEQNNTIRDTVHRAVARIDVMFIKARKEGNIYIEEPYSGNGDIFGNLGLGKLELRFNNIPNQMTLMGTPLSGTMNATINAPYLSDGAVTVGNGDSTIIGKDTYFRFDSVQTRDIIRGSAHVFGTYLLPNPDNNMTATLQLYAAPQITNRGGVARTINIYREESNNLIPLEQNKVTLIKVYVLRDDHLFGTDPDNPEPPEPPVPPVPPTPPGPDDDFDIAIEVIVLDDWDESHHINFPVE